ncbi:MAG: biopolymer transporter ExbD [bacterium]|nr:biopolymer transporter ExbD [bacterium]
MKVRRAVMNLSPLCDISFTILMTLMVTIPIIAIPSKIKVDLPEARTVEQREEDNITVTVSAEGLIAVCDIDTTIEEAMKILESKIKAEPDKMVIIRADKYVRHGVVLDILRAAKVFGAKRVGIATEQKGRK